MTNQKYILKGKEIVPVDLLEWGKWFEAADRHIGNDTINGKKISTVFLGLDHQFGDGPPLLFETMVFDTGKKEKYKIGGREKESMGKELEQVQYSTDEEAEAGHKRFVEKYS